MTSIRRRLLIGGVVGVAATFVIAGVIVLALARAALRDQLDAALVAKAEAMAALVEQDREELESELAAIAELGSTVEHHQLWTEQGAVAGRSRSLGAETLIAAPTTRAGDRVLGDVTLPGGGSGRQITLRFTPRADPDDLAGHPRQTAVLAIARSTATVDDAVARIERVLLGVGVGGTLVCALVILIVVAFGLRPVRALASSIAAIRADQLTARVDPAATPEELAPIAARLNELLGRLEIAFARERELTAEVAHELRTPLAGLRATIEVAIDRDRSADRYRAALASCLTICTQTERVVEMLLSLARLDAGRVQARAETVEVDELVRDVLAPLAPRATDRKLELTTELAPVTWTTDRDQLRVVVTNLIDNALAYADEGGDVRVELTASRLRISNPTRTLTADAARHAFERFWRDDAARSAGTHAGLGLALCKKLVDLLRGSIHATVLDGRFVVTLELGTVST